MQKLISYRVFLLCECLVLTEKPPKKKISLTENCIILKAVYIAIIIIILILTLVFSPPGFISSLCRDFCSLFVVVCLLSFRLAVL